MRLLLVRHGETAWNAEQRYQGQSDVPLSQRGHEQAAALARVLTAETIHALYASDLQRAWATALAVATPLGLPVHKEPRLREITFGQWEGMTTAEIQARDAETLALWRTDPARIAPPGGETLQQVATRVRAAFDSLIATYQEQTIMLVAHSGTLRVLLCLALGFPVQAYRRFALNPTSLSELYISDQGAVLTRLNDTRHLTEVDRAG